MVLFVDLQMLGEVIDTPCQQRNLNFRRTGVIRVRAIFIYNSLRVVHEVLSYASKSAGGSPLGECLGGMIARSRCIGVSKDVRIQSSVFSKKAMLHPSWNDNFDFDLDQP